MITSKYTGILRIFITLMILLQGCQNHNKVKLNLPVDLKVVNLDKSIKMEEVLSKKIKVVAFFRGHFSFERVLPLYKDFVGKYENIGFVFYLNYNYDNNISEYLQNIGIYYPVFYDPKDSFLRTNTYINQNNNFMGFIVDSDNKILDITNPTIPGFKKKLLYYNH